MSNSENRRSREVANRCTDDIGFTVLIIFGIANVLFISYVAVEHKVQQDYVDAEINDVSKILRRLKNQILGNDCYSDKKLCQEIVSAKSKLESCERKGSIISLLQDEMRKKKQYLKMWDSIPKPFIHAEMKVMRGRHITTGDLKGWNVTRKSGDNCEELDPVIAYDKGRIKIQMPGYYYVYSQVTFQCLLNTGHKKHLHRHTTVLLTTGRKPLMLNSYQLCMSGDEGQLKVSYHSGIFQLERSNQLLINVQMPRSTTLFVDQDYHNDDLFFGAYLV